LAVQGLMRVPELGLMRVLVQGLMQVLVQGLMRVLVQGLMRVLVLVPELGLELGLKQTQRSSLPMYPFRPSPRAYF